MAEPGRRRRADRRAAGARRGPAVRHVGRVLGMFVGGAAGVIALAACGGVEGTVVAKTHQGSYDRACQASGIVTAPLTVPVSEVCSVPECWRLVLRNSDGDTVDACVSREEYDRSRLGEFRHVQTDR